MIRLLAVGDIALYGDYVTRIHREGPHAPFSYAASYLKQGDVVFGNLEAPLSDLGRADPSKPICLRGSPKGVEALSLAGFTHVSLANNHSYDYGTAALVDTKRRLEQAGIATIGVGQDLAVSRQPCVQTFPWGSLAFLAYSAYTTGGRRYARKNGPGVAPLEYRHIKEDIRALRQRYDPLAVVVSLHWGVEGNHYPTPFQRHLAHRVVEAGADLILGHHPHVMQGIEQYRNGLVVYSLGDFCFPYVIPSRIQGLERRKRPQERESFILRCDVGQDGIRSYETIPIYINGELQPCPAVGERGRAILHRLRLWSQPLTERSVTEYERFYVKEVGNSGGYATRLSGLLKREGVVGIRKRLRLVYARALGAELRDRIRERLHECQARGGRANG